jgi:hypothetical protein
MSEEMTHASRSHWATFKLGNARTGFIWAFVANGASLAARGFSEFI